MAVIATDSTRFSAVVKYELEPQLSLCRESIVINDAAATLPVGTVLGKVTATGKYKVVDKDATDGSEVAAGVLIADGLGMSRDIALAAATDTKALILARGPAIVTSLVYGDTVHATVDAQLKALGITVETAV